MVFLKAMFEFVKKNWKAVLLAATVATMLMLGLATGYLVNKNFELSRAIATKNLIIDAKASEIQDFSAELGLSESNLRTQSELNEKHLSEILAFKDQLKTKAKEIDLKNFQLKSREETIAALKGLTSGGTTVITIDGEQGDIDSIVELNKIISYSWADTANRFVLKDPNIIVKNDETFTYSQNFRVKGLVLSDPSGNVQVSKVIIEEVIPVEKDGEIVYRVVEGGEITLISSEFDYALMDDKPKQFDWLAPITLRPVVGMSFPYFSPTVGIEVFNFGRWWDYANVGIVPNMAFDISGLPQGNFRSLQRSRVGIGLVYQFLPPAIDTNIGLGATLSVPMNKLDSPMLSVDLVVYLTSDLFPF